MNWVKSEYILKGVYLGLLLFAALQNLDWQQTGVVALWMVGGLGVALVLGAVRISARVRGLARSPVGFLLYVLLENPLLVYAGLILGLACGGLSERAPIGSEENPTGQDPRILGYCLLGGAVLGYGLGELRAAKLKGMYKFFLALAVAAGLVTGIWYWFQETGLLDNLNQQRLGLQILLGLPFFYLLSFAGLAEESEVEIAALCAGLGLGLFYTKLLPTLPALVFILPIGLYCVYTIRVLQPLRVFKHTLRGFGYTQANRIRPALVSFNRALQLDPKNALAKQGLVRIHKMVEPGDLDPETLALMNPNLCLAQAANILVGGPSPTSEQLAEARKLLNMVDQGWPNAKPRVEYYRVIADTHARLLDPAVDRLDRLLDPTLWEPTDRARNGILFDAWQLALRTHPVLKARAGDPQLALPGRRIEAIRAAHRQVALVPNDPVVTEFRAELLADVTEEEYAESSTRGPHADFPYPEAEALGMGALKDPESWGRASLFLRIAAHGQPARAPSILQHLVEASTQRGNVKETKEYRVLIREAGREFGPTQLPADQKPIYFAAVKKLSEEAAAIGDYKEAIFDLSLYTQNEDSGKPTLRTLAEYYEKDGQVMHALRVTEKALLFGSDADLLQMKDRYYYSVTPEELKEKAEEVRSYFDVKYCVAKAKATLDSKTAELELLDWADHLCRLALVMQPKNVIALVQQARCHLRRGDRDEGLRILEDVHEMKPSGGDETEAWFFALKQLAMLYLDEYNRPDLAIVCLREFQKGEKSGADTIYHLGRAYEKKGDFAAAIKCYEAVQSFDKHPLRFDAEEAARRLKAPAET